MIYELLNLIGVPYGNEEEAAALLEKLFTGRARIEGLEPVEPEELSHEQSPIDGAEHAVVAALFEPESIEPVTFEYQNAEGSKTTVQEPGMPVLDISALMESEEELVRIGKEYASELDNHEFDLAPLAAVVKGVVERYHSLGYGKKDVDDDALRRIIKAWGKGAAIGELLQEFQWLIQNWPEYVDASMRASYQNGVLENRHSNTKYVPQVKRFQLGRAFTSLTGLVEFHETNKEQRVPIKPLLTFGRVLFAVAIEAMMFPSDESGHDGYEIFAFIRQSNAGKVPEAEYNPEFMDDEQLDFHAHIERFWYLLQGGWSRSGDEADEMITGSIADFWHEFLDAATTEGCILKLGSTAYTSYAAVTGVCALVASYGIGKVLKVGARAKGLVESGMIAAGNSARAMRFLQISERAVELARKAYTTSGVAAGSVITAGTTLEALGVIDSAFVATNALMKSIGVCNKDAAKEPTPSTPVKEGS